VRAPRSLRWQLMLVFTGIAAVVVVAAAVGMLILIEQAVWGPLDAAIEEEAETLARIRNIAPVEDLQRAVANVGSEAAPGPGKLIRVTAAGGETLAEAGRMPPEIAGLVPPLEATTHYATVGGGRDPYRVVWYAVEGGGWSEVAVRIGAQVGLLRRARFAIIGGATGLLATLAMLAWLPSSRRSRPARSIGASCRGARRRSTGWRRS